MKANGVTGQQREDTTPPVDVSDGAISSDVQLDGQMRIGRHLRELRHDRKLTLADVAEGTGLSASFLSLVEQGKSDVSIGRLNRLVLFYGRSIADVLAGSSARDWPIVGRRGKLRELISSEEGIEVEFFTPLNGLQMMPYVSTFAPGGANSEFARHDGEEFVYVLEGEIVIELEGFGHTHLEAGDFIYFRATTPHHFSNPVQQPARLLGAVTPPSL